jgi:hypothetical protein
MLCVVRSNVRCVCVRAVRRRVVCAICILHHTNTVLLSFSPQVHEGRDGSKWDDGVDAGRGDGGHGGDGLLIRAFCQVREGSFLLLYYSRELKH